MKSINTISSSIRKSELSHTKIFMKRTPDERKRDRSFNEFLEVSEYGLNDSKPLKYESPYHKYYLEKIKGFKEFLTHTSDSPDYHPNEFYCPKLFTIIASQLYLLPVWSGIIIYHQKIGYDTKTRLSNNPVENWIGQLKNNILRADNIVSVYIFGSNN